MWESGLLETLTAGSFAALAAIHKKLFAEIDDLAGQLRTVNLGRGNGHFTPVLELRAALVHIERMPQAGLDDILAKYLAMNLAHPFPRGNGRSMRIWLDLMLKRELGRARNLPGERGYKGAQHAKAKESPKAQIQRQQGPADSMCRSAPCARLLPPPGAQLRQTSASGTERRVLCQGTCGSPKRALPKVPFRGNERARFRTMPAGCRSPAMAGTSHAPRQAPGIGRPVAIDTPLIEAVLSMAGPIAAKAANRPKPISGLPLTPCRLGHPSIFLIVTKYQA